MNDVSPAPLPDSADPLIRLTGVQLTLSSAAGAVHILRGLDLEVPRGEALAVVGPSGAGKSSLLLVTAGLEQASGGRITVAGTELKGLGEDALARFRRDHIGIVFQDFHLIPTMTALENVAVPLELAGNAQAFARAEASLAAVGLGHRLSHYPSQLSGGEQQRVAIARAFVVEPPLLLADEPTGNLDGETGQRIIELLFALRERHGTTLLLITHDAAIARRCGRRLRLVDGRIVESDGEGDAAITESVGTPDNGGSR
jgi:putative ABC transport system ATP-binding protein